MKTIALLHMPFSMGMGRAAQGYKKIFENMKYQVKTMNWFDFITEKRSYIEKSDILFSFVVPQPHLMKLLKQIVSNYNVSYGMVVWETDQPPPCFNEYVSLFNHTFAPSQFTAKMFDTYLTFLPHHVHSNNYILADVNSGLKQMLVTPGFKFYSISDFADSRKNVETMVDGFLKAGLPNAKLVLKHNRPSTSIKHHPHIINIVGEFTDSDMEFLHDTCHCYVNLSYSEGVGLGIIEAAIRQKPIIMTDYGGQNDYVKTPWLVKTTKGNVPFNEFLFTTDMTWGIPDTSHYIDLLKEVYHTSPKTYNHDDTRRLVSQKSITKILKKQGL